MLADLRAAFAFLTVLPVGYPAGRKPGYAFAWFPLVGLTLGALLWLVGSLLSGSAEVKAFLLLGLWVVFTGGLHLDGLGDSCDGLFSTTTPTRRLEIMQDPRAGVWAVVGLVLLLLGKWVCLREVAPLLLLAPPVLARWAMMAAAFHFPHAPTPGLGIYFREGLGQEQWLTASLLTGTILLMLVPFTDWRMLILVLAPACTVYLCGRWAANRLGGLTGDVYGAIGELTELVALVMMVAIL